MVGTRLTAWGKIAKKKLYGKEPYPYIFEGIRPIAEPGERDTALFRITGTVIAAVSSIPGTTADHVYALLYDAVADLGATESGELWLDELWDMITRLWKDTADEYAEIREHKETLQTRVSEGFAKWSGEDDIEEIARRAVVATPTSFYVLGPDGYYSSTPYKKDLLVAAIKQQGMETVIPIWYPKADGSGLRQARAQEIVDIHGTVCTEVEGVAGQKGSYIRNNNVFCLNLYNLRTDITPERNEDVDAWIQSLCNTEEEYEKLCNWIGNALAFDEGPICALSIKGPPGCGKKLLSQGLAECVASEQVASAEDFGEFASQLFKTPFLAVNEGFPTFTDGMHPADSFRKLTAGDPISAAKKFHDRVTIRAPLRLMFFANNYSVLRSLGHKRDLSPQDRDAIAMRIFHINVPNDAAAHLLTRGGLSYTRGWIRGDDGSLSGYVVARHFLWLYKNRKPMKYGARLLVEGELNPEVLRVLSTQSGAAPEVIETVVSMIEANLSDTAGILLEDKEVYVTISGVLSHHRNIISTKTGTRLSASNVSSVLNGLLEAGWDPHDPRMLAMPGGKKTRRSSWWKIPAATLYREAVDNGYACKRLESAVYSIPATPEPATLGDSKEVSGDPSTTERE